MAFNSAARVKVSRDACRAIMQSDKAQQLVLAKAEQIAASANESAGFDGYYAHVKNLEVSAHAYVECGGRHAIYDNNKHDRIKQAFWSNQG
jgi:lauroyl/myristoyl acyltransferase